MLSMFAFNMKLRHYSKGSSSSGALLRFDVRQLKTACLYDRGVRGVQLSMDRHCMVVEIVDQGVPELRHGGYSQQALDPH